MLAHKEAKPEMKALTSFIPEKGHDRQYSEDFDMEYHAQLLFEDLREYLPKLQAPEVPIANETEENADGPSEVRHVILCLVVFLFLVGFGFLLLSYPQLLQSWVGSFVQMLETPIPLYWKKAQEPPYVEYGPPYIPQEPTVTTVAETSSSLLTKVGMATGATLFGAAGVAFWIFVEANRPQVINLTTEVATAATTAGLAAMVATGSSA
jgi:hypothetical protein